MAAIVFPTDPDRLNYVSTPWTDGQGKQWTYDPAKNRWNPYLSSAAPGGGAVSSVNGYTGAVTLTKSDLSLGNVDNVSDLNKPISTATQAALDLKANASALSGYLTIASAASTYATAASLTSHTGNTSNPHSVTAAQIGLGSVENTALSTWDGSSNITTLGTIATGTWQGTIIAPAYLGTGTSIGTKFLRGDGTWQTLPGGGDATTSGTLDQFADVTQTAGQTLAINASTTLSGGTHSGTNTGDITVTGNGLSLTGQQLALSIGTGSTQVAAGNHTHAELHAAVTLAASLADVLSLSTQALGAVDAAADKLPIWDDLAGKLTYATLGTGLSYSAATLSVDADATATNNSITKRDSTGRLVANAVIATGGQSSFSSTTTSGETAYGNSATWNYGTGRAAEHLAALGGLPTAGGTLTGNLTLAENAAVVLDPSGSADEKWTGTTIPGTAGETLAIGDLVYLDAAATKWNLADADAASTSGDVMLGLSLSAAAADAAINVLLHGTMRSAAFPASMTVGAPIYVSTTAGDITTTQPSGTDDVIRRVGFVITAEPNTIYFSPSADYTTHT